GRGEGVGDACAVAAGGPAAPGGNCFLPLGPGDGSGADGVCGAPAGGEPCGNCLAPEGGGGTAGGAPRRSSSCAGGAALGGADDFGVPGGGGGGGGADGGVGRDGGAAGGADGGVGRDGRPAARVAPPGVQQRVAPGVAWAFRRDRVLLSGPRSAARPARAMSRRSTASLQARSWQAARNEALS